MIFEPTSKYDLNNSQGLRFSTHHYLKMPLIFYKIKQKLLSCSMWDISLQSASPGGFLSKASLFIIAENGSLLFSMQLACYSRAGEPATLRISELCTAVHSSVFPLEGMQDNSTFEQENETTSRAREFTVFWRHFCSFFFCIKMHKKVNFCNNVQFVEGLADDLLASLAD